MERTNEDIIRYRFTSYLLVALKRTKRDYICRESKIGGHENLSEEQFSVPLEATENKSLLWEEVEKISLTPDAVRQYLESQVGDAAKAALDTLTELEILVVFMKVFKQMTYVEIGKYFDMEWKKAGSVFGYARKKMQKGWEN